MHINPLIFRAYDIRGIAHVPESDKAVDLNPETMESIGRASGMYFLQHFGRKIALGYDCRLSNPELANAFIKGALTVGCDITNLGMITSPMLYFAVCEFGFDGGVSITASHNPKEYNGVKLVGKGAHSICGDELQTILGMIQSQASSAPANISGQLDTLNVFPAYLKKIVEIVKPEKNLTIVVDSGNGATGPYVKQLFESLGAKVITLFTDPDGNYPNHEANPEELENMHDLIAAVKANKADIGFGFDGDGDRVGVIDEKGNHYSADLMLLLLARDLLTRQPGSKIVFDAKASQVLIDDIKKHGGEPVMAKTGHSFIETKMKEIGAPLAGEISGHLFFAENYYGFDDAFLGAARLLELLSKTDKTFSKLLADIPQTFTTPEIKAPCPDDKKFAIVDSIKNAMTSKYDCITIDGVRVNFDSSSWGAVRCSNTSPNLTLRFEAQNENRLREIIAIMLAELEKYPEINLSPFEKWKQ